MKSNVLIIGCGNIAGGFDATSTSTGLPRTHASAYKTHLGFNLLACLDPDESKLKKFQNIWKIPYGFSSFEDIRKQDHSYDVISICSPSIFHYEHISEAIKLKPKIIFCEKPTTTSFSDTLKIYKRCLNNNIILITNYSRGWDPSMITISKNIKNKKWGKTLFVNVFYSNGILNNGSHALDFLIRSFGKINISSVIKESPLSNNIDKNVSVYLESVKDKVPIYFHPIENSNYSVFEINIFFEQNVVRILNGGLVIFEQNIIKNKYYPDFRIPSPPKFKTANYMKSMKLAIKDIDNLLRNPKDSNLFDNNFLEVEKLCSKILQFNRNLKR